MQSINTYKEAIDYLFGQLPMFQRIGAKALKFDLSNITALMAALGNPQDNLTYIHVAGTNGKGSVCHYLSSMLQEAGYNVGLYTSPHYKEYRERIRYNGQLIPKKYVVSFLNRLRHQKIMMTLTPSFFEIGVAMAFCYYDEVDADVVVLETGLGGRLDSTNIITPIVSVITNIGYDHQATLGNTLSKIAAEKAGIIKYKVPVVVGEKQEETTPVFELFASSQNADLTYAEDVQISIDVSTITPIVYLQNNIRTALVALANTHLNVSQQQKETGIDRVVENTGYMGRWQVISDHPKVIIDAAHNQEGLKQLAINLTTVTFEKLHIVLGMVGDKPLEHVLPLLPKQAKYYFAKANIPRGKDATLLMEEAKAFDLNGKGYTSVRKALSSAKLSAKENDLVLVTGSIFTVAEVV